MTDPFFAIVREMPTVGVTIGKITVLVPPYLKRSFRF